MTIKRILAICLSSVLVIYFQLADADITNGWPINRIVAVVNNQVITQDQLNQQVILAKGQLQKSNTPLPDENTLETQVLQQLIDRQLQLQVAQRAGIQVTSSDVDNAISDIASGNNMTVNQLYAAIATQGLTVRQFRDEIRQEVTVQQVQKQIVSSRIKLSVEETNDAMRAILAQIQANQAQYHVADILFNLPNNPTPAQQAAVQQQAVSIANQLRAGANLNRVTANIPASVGAYSDLGWRSLGDLPDEFANALQGMQPGDTSDPILTPNGFHVIQLLGEKGNQTIPSHNVIQSKVQIIVLYRQPGMTDQMIIARLQNFLQQINEGRVSFGILAEKYSQDVPSQLQGGNLGWMEPGHLPPAVDQAIAVLPAGGISQPIATGNGWYLVHVLAKRTMLQASATVYQQVQNLLFHRKFEQQLQAWLASLRSQSYVKILAPEYQSPTITQTYD